MIGGVTRTCYLTYLGSPASMLTGPKGLYFSSEIVLCLCPPTTAKKCIKKRDVRAKLLFCKSKPIYFLPFSFPLPSPSSLVKLRSLVRS